MGRFKEAIKAFRGIKENLDKTKKVSKEAFPLGALGHLANPNYGGWKSKFISDIYEERILYPHEEMETAKKGFLYNAHIHAAVTSLNCFLLGGELKVSSKNTQTEDWLNDMLRSTGLKNIFMQFAFIDLVVSGNFYCERMRQKSAIVAYDYIPDPERMYADQDAKGLTASYIYRLPEEQHTGTNFKTIKYYGDRRKSIKGIPLEVSKVLQFRIGMANIRNYGRGLVCSVINDVQIIVEVERAIAVIARYKAIPKKLLMLVKANGPQDTDIIANALNNVGDDENPIVPFEMKVEDLSYAGKELNFEPILNYLKKKVTVALAPSYLIHGDETSYAVSKEQRVSLELKVNAMRAVVSEQLKRELRTVAKSHKKVIAEFEIEFGTYDLGQEEELRKSVIETWNAGLITLDEARENIKYPKDSDNGEFYSWELKNATEEEEEPESETGESKNKKNF